MKKASSSTSVWRSWKTNANIEKNPDPVGENMNKRQKIVVFEQNGKSEAKTAGILEFGKGRFELEVVSMESDLPPVIDDARDFFPVEDRGGPRPGLSGPSGHVPRSRPDLRRAGHTCGGVGKKKQDQGGFRAAHLLRFGPARFAGRIRKAFRRAGVDGRIDRG